MWTLGQARCLCLPIFVSYCSNYILFDNQIRSTKTALSRQGHTCLQMSWRALTCLTLQIFASQKCKYRNKYRYKCPGENWLVLPFKYIRDINTNNSKITITNTNTNVIKIIDWSHLTNIYGIAEKNYRPQLLRQKFYPEMCICTLNKCVRSCPWYRQSRFTVVCEPLISAFWDTIYFLLLHGLRFWVLQCFDMLHFTWYIKVRPF